VALAKMAQAIQLFRVMGFLSVLGVICIAKKSGMAVDAVLLASFQSLDVAAQSFE